MSQLAPPSRVRRIASTEPRDPVAGADEHHVGVVGLDDHALLCTPSTSTVSGAWEPITGRGIPVPSARRTGEHDVAVPADTAAKAALMLALRESGLSRSAFARRLGVDVKVVRRMLDPRHRTAASRIGAALHELGRELVVETHVLEPVR